MTGEEMIVAIVAIVAGTIFTGVVFSKIVGLIKTWINRKHTTIDEEEFDRLAQAFIRYKKDSEKRIQHLEARLAEEQPKMEGETPSAQRISLDDSNTELGESSNLRNMLRE